MPVHGGKVGVAALSSYPSVMSTPLANQPLTNEQASEALMKQEVLNRL